MAIQAFAILFFVLTASNLILCTLGHSDAGFNAMLSFFPDFMAEPYCWIPRSRSATSSLDVSLAHSVWPVVHAESFVWRLATDFRMPLCQLPAFLHTVAES